MSDALDGLSLSLSDIALVARVKRPVVTVWRRRSAASDLPFPAPLPTGGRQESFDAQQVVTWLEATGRGNNPSAREGVAAFSDVGGGSNRTDDHVFNGLSALLCLGVVSGERLGELDEAELLDLADEADPDDEFLYTEVEELGDQVTSVARYADLLADAAFSHAEAFETLVRSRNRRRVSVETTQTLAEPARDLVARLAVALAQEAGLATPTFVDPTQGGGDLLVAVVDQLGEDHAATTLTGDHDDPVSRLARRRLRVHDVLRNSMRVADDGAYEIAGPAVHVARFPAPASPGMSTDEILTAIDNIVLQMDDAHRAIVVAPASVLVHTLRTAPSDQLRAEVLRSGHVRAIVLLPKGLVPAKPRQQLALWVLGPAYGDVPLADRWTTVADLTNESLTGGSTEDLVTDIVAAMGGVADVRAHAFRFGRVVFTRHLLAMSGDLVQPSARAGARTPSAVELALRIAAVEGAASGQAFANPLGSRTIEVRNADRPSEPPPLVLGQAVASRQVRLLPGNRIDPSDIGGGEGVRVIGPEELTGAAELGSRAVDPLQFAAAYETGRYTEPGDVVFCTSPEVAALVDVEGSSVVVYPARVLRIRDDAGFDPHVLARDVNAQPASAKAWKSWPVRRVPRDQLVELSTVLSRIDEERSATRRRITHLDELAKLVTLGVASGSLVIKPTESEGS